MGTKIPTTGVAKYIADLAIQHNIHYVRTEGDAMADVIARVVDDEVIMDDVELLLLALERAGVIASKDVVPLHVNYLREKFGREESGGSR
ncbi:hypothetical protein TspCOW1_12580 [Thiohalobacter sp. COW1]|uniref:hypothetical protein n=1 Tax=Thiohalobacter sp. COW1 TaxID=2795687 RepID=UPI00191535ED|nr:hypothetical protein [Thiohalobacter sp. COW1]BCO31155.1 hypothetical protein TspCOW1_12580 [Thiohalobacter sp. COW1]